MHVYNCEAYLTPTQGPAVAIARGCGACLNFNPMFVLVLMFRHVLSWIRSTRFYFLFPLDNITKLHKIVGWMIFFFACVHTFAHIANFSKFYFMQDAKLQVYRINDAYFASLVYMFPFSLSQPLFQWDPAVFLSGSIFLVFRQELAGYMVLLDSLVSSWLFFWRSWCSVLCRE